MLSTERTLVVTYLGKSVECVWQACIFGGTGFLTAGSPRTHIVFFWRATGKNVSDAQDSCEDLRLAVEIMEKVPLPDVRES